MTDSPDEWVSSHGDALFRYAIKHVRDRELAADLVQETFLAAWKARVSFDGRSSRRTWLIGILRHKMFDVFRRTKRERPADDPELFDYLAEREEFRDNGHWAHAQSNWYGTPEEHFEQDQFWTVFERCLEALPETMELVFRRRSLEGIETDTVCQELGVSSTNLYVLLYRARMKLRSCLDKNWFNTEPTGKSC